MGQANFASTGKSSTADYLSPEEFRSFKVKAIKPYNYNTKLFEIALPDAEVKSGLPVASCLFVEGLDKDGKPVARPYTPVSSFEQRGAFTLLIKEYPQGVVSRYMHRLKPGDELRVKGPASKLPYEANKYKRLGMVAGGTGITPMIQILHKILGDPKDKTQVTLVFANIAEEDILMREMLDSWQEKHDNFKVYHVIEKAPAGWKQGTGRLSMDIVKDQLPPPEEGSMVLVCGPPGFMKAISGDKAPDKSQGEVEGLLKERGFNKDQVYKF